MFNGILEFLNVAFIGGVICISSIFIAKVPGLLDFYKRGSIISSSRSAFAGFYECGFCNGALDIKYKPDLLKNICMFLLLEIPVLYLFFICFSMGRAKSQFLFSIGLMLMIFVTELITFQEFDKDR